MNRWRGLYAGVALTAMATLLLELALTRIFSVVLFYHFAFMAISVALFGLGVGAIVSYYLAGRGEDCWARLGLMSAVNTPLTILVLVGILRQNVSIELSAATAWKLAGVYFLAALPFFSGGLVDGSSYNPETEHTRECKHCIHQCNREGNLELFEARWKG